MNEVEPYAEYLWRHPLNLSRRRGISHAIEEIASLLVERQTNSERDLLLAFRKAYGAHEPLPPDSVAIDMR